MPKRSEFVHSVSGRKFVWSARIFALFLSLTCSLLVAACQSGSPSEASSTVTPQVVASIATPADLADSGVDTLPDVEVTAVPDPDAPELPTPQPAPFYTGPLSPSCGQLLTAVPPPAAPQITNLDVDDTQRAALQQAVSPAAWPALARLLDAPATVGLVAYQLGQPDTGVYLNENMAMPLASVVKLINLVAYSEAVASGELNPLEQVPLAELDRYYLPNFDLGAHERAVEELRANGRVSTGDNPTVALEDVVRMMIRHSSNAASDYLHQRLGQMRIEQTAVDLGLTTQTAPCPFIGQFLLMGNPSLSQSAAIAKMRAYLTVAPSDYGADIMLLTDAYANQEDFRESVVDWRRQTRGPSIELQRFFSENLNAQASPADYARLMARLAQNGLNSPDSSFQARRIVEWPMQFPDNQELFSNLGYKNGSLPGVLTTAYYTYRWSDGAPVVVVLFYRDLPQETYRQWRRGLPHDELARWLLSDPQAIPLLRSVLVP